MPFVGAEAELDDPLVASTSLCVCFNDPRALRVGESKQVCIYIYVSMYVCAWMFVKCIVSPSLFSVFTGICMSTLVSVTFRNRLLL